MNHISSRIYEHEKDFQIILNLTARLRPSEHLNDYPGRTDIEEDLASAVTRANTRLWFNGKRPVGWAYVDEFHNLRWEHDRSYEAQIGMEIVEWGELCIRTSLVNGKTTTLDANCREDYTERISFLHRFGFQQTEGFNVSLTRQLSESIPEPELPPGFIIRSIKGMDEAKAIAAMHRAAFGTEYMTTENRLAIMNTSGYDPSLDLLVLAPDGTIAAYCTCSVNERDKRGSTDPVATHPKYQRLGLARALLLTGLKLLKERGMTSAHLGTSGNNVAMQKAATSAGFTIEYKTIWFSKEVK